MNTIWKATSYITAWGVLSGALLGTLYGVGTLLLFHGAVMTGVVFGAFVGGITGLGAGFVCGVAVGVSTRLFFYPPNNLRYFRWTLAVLCVLITFSIVFVVLSQLIAPAVNDAPKWAVLPAVIATLATLLGVQRFANQYITAHQSITDQTHV